MTNSFNYDAEDCSVYVISNSNNNYNNYNNNHPNLNYENNNDNLVKKEIEKVEKLTKKDILIILLLCYGNFAVATAYSLIAPFFPTEAKNKGASTTEVGLIFGAYEIVIFLASPVFGKMIPHVTPKFMLINGAFVCGACCIIFGFLEWSPNGPIFVTLCFVVRIIEAFGSAAFFTSCWTIIAISYPERVGKLFATVEMCFGIGMIVGASLGGVIYEVGKKYLFGGFCMPFFVIGIFLLLGAIVMWIFLNEKKNELTIKKTSAIKVIKHFSISLNVLISVNAFILIGFNEATLGIHIKSFSDLPESMIGVIFVIGGCFYAVCNQIWGIIAEKVPNSHPLCIIGSILSMVCFIIIGPLPFFNLEPSLGLVITSQIFLGLGLGGQFVGSFIQAFRETSACGFPNNISTTAVVSGLFSSAFALGSSIGPSIGGYLIDVWGYRWTTIPFVFCQIIMISVIIIFNTVRYFSNKKNLANK